jgi:hypothetical protein
LVDIKAHKGWEGENAIVLVVSKNKLVDICNIIQVEQGNLQLEQGLRTDIGTRTRYFSGNKVLTWWKQWIIQLAEGGYAVVSLQNKGNVKDYRVNVEYFFSISSICEALFT